MERGFTLIELMKNNYEFIRQKDGGREERGIIQFRVKTCTKWQEKIKEEMAH
ncbi:MAG: hypothetical protein ACOYN6_13160 [Ignavibacteria bacterium]|jgi:hypothetical protein